MTEFDISHMMFEYEDRPVRRTVALTEMLDWVYKHIGPETEKTNLTAPVHRRGIGWEIQTRRHISEKLKKLSPKSRSVNVISWVICIEDEQLATVFALRWGLK